MLAVDRGAQLIRVHDVKEAVQTMRVWSHLQNMNNNN